MHFTCLTLGGKTQIMCLVINSSIYATGSLLLYCIQTKIKPHSKLYWWLLGNAILRLLLDYISIGSHSISIFILVTDTY